MSNFDLEKSMETVRDSINEENIVKYFDVIANNVTKLRHYCSLDACGSILSGSVWLSHAEYSNDENEIVMGKNLVKDILYNMFGKNYLTKNDYDNILQDFTLASKSLEVYIWCLSDLPSADDLSQWRAYGADGKGTCITINKSSISAICGPNLRINPVIYDINISSQLIENIIKTGLSNGSTPVDIAGSLLYVLPLIKHNGFKDEREWRLLYARTSGSTNNINYRMSRDLYSPYCKLKEILETDSILRDHNKNIDMFTKSPLLQIEEIMIGPSRHKILNSRSMIMNWTQSLRPNLSVVLSDIPYRS